MRPLYHLAVTRIEISAAAYAALAASATRGLLEPRRSPEGGYSIWLPRVASGGTTTPTDMLLTGELAGIRLVLAKARRIRLDRKPDDAPQVVESWL